MNKPDTAQSDDSRKMLFMLLMFQRTMKTWFMAQINHISRCRAKIGGGMVFPDRYAQVTVEYI